MVKVSVIIPTYNRSQMVCECIDSVLKSTFQDFEIVVVDDCSPDDTREKIAAAYGNEKRLRYIRNEKNSYQAASRNNGAEIAQGDYMLFLDDDNKVHPDMIEELLSAFARHEDAGLVAPLAIHQRSGKENLIWTLGSDFNRWTSQPCDKSPNLELSKFKSEEIDYPTTYSPNAFMVKASLYREVGGTDASFVQIYEESDLGWRIVENGYTAWIATRARTNHFGFLEKDCAQELRQLGIERPARTYYFARNRIRFARRHFSFLNLLSIIFIFAPLSVFYYAFVALKNKRADIAWAYFKGTFVGVIFGLVCKDRFDGIKK